MLPVHLVTSHCPRIRDDIDTYHRLNFHLYQALRKALFKPGAFFKVQFSHSVSISIESSSNTQGFLLPLCESGTCTLREAIIVGECLKPNSHNIFVLVPMMKLDTLRVALAERFPSDPSNPRLGAGARFLDSGAWEGLRERPSYPLAGGRTKVRGGTQKFGPGLEH